MRQKSQLAAALRREIYAPLNSIIATAEQLRRSGLDLAQREHAEELAASARALLSLVTDLLDISKADTERLPERQVATDAFVHAPAGSRLAPSTWKREPPPAGRARRRAMPQEAKTRT